MRSVAPPTDDFISPVPPEKGRELEKSSGTSRSANSGVATLGATSRSLGKGKVGFRTAFVTDAEMQACYQAHAQLLQKPSLRNLITCWRVHGYLMQRR